MFQRLAQAFHVPAPTVSRSLEIPQGDRVTMTRAATPTQVSHRSVPLQQEALPQERSFSERRQSFIEEEEEKRKRLFETCASLPRSTYDPHSMALTGFSEAHQEGHRDGDTIKVYQRVTRPPLQRGVVRQGNGTVEQVLQESSVYDRPIVQLEQGRTLQIPLTRVPYRMCSDVPDHAPFDRGCLQSLFREMGGTPAGSMYPSEHNMVEYHTMGTLGAIRQQWSHILSQMAHPDPTVQQQAMRAMLGAVPAVKRAPYHPGVEAFWFIKDAGRIVGFVGRTLEKDMAPKDGSDHGEAVLYLTDVRVTHPMTVTFRVRSKGFWMAVHQPALMDHTACRHLADRMPLDRPGLFLDLHDAESRSPTPLHVDRPNLMKYYGSPSDVITCPQGTMTLACDVRDPFATFEVDPVSRTFQELRNPGLFSFFCSMRSLEMYTRTEERMSVPGQRPFARMNSSQSGIHLSNLHAGSWRTLTVAFRMISMPIKETLFHIRAGVKEAFFSVVLTTINGSTAEMRLEEGSQGKTRVVPTPYRLSVNHWYVLVIQQTSEGMRIQVVPHGQPAFDPVYVVRHESLFGSQLCTLSLGTQGIQAASTTSFQYDVAWIHLFDYLWGHSVPTPPWRRKRPHTPLP